jgi:peptide methionine sulfoxide reductase MsrB
VPTPAILIGIVVDTAKECFESVGGWQDFASPVQPGNMKGLRDSSHAIIPIAVRRTFVDNRPAQGFSDRRQGRRGRRYRVNPASLPCVPRGDMLAGDFCEHLDKAEDE